MRQLVESFKRLYMSNQIDENKINELCDSGKITAEEKKYILAQ